MGRYVLNSLTAVREQQTVDALSHHVWPAHRGHDRRAACGHGQRPEDAFDSVYPACLPLLKLVELNPVLLVETAVDW